MSKAAFAEKLAALIHELPRDAKKKLRLTDIWHLVPRKANKPRALLKAYDGLEKALVARRHPCSPRALGKCLARWWARIQGRMLTERKIDGLFAHRPDAEIREALASFAAECLTEEGETAHETH